MSEFDQAAYSAGYGECASLIDTYGVEWVRRYALQVGGRVGGEHADWTLGFQTCLGVTLERELQG